MPAQNPTHPGAQQGAMQAGNPARGGNPHSAQPSGGYQAGGFQNGITQHGQPPGRYQNGAAQIALPPSGYANGASLGQPGSVQNGGAAHGYGQGGAQQSGSPNGWPQIAANQGGLLPPVGQSGPLPGDMYGAPGGQPGFDAASVPSQAHQFYGAPDPGFFPDQPVAGQDQGRRAPFGSSPPAQTGGGAFPAQPPHQPQSQSASQLPAVRAMQAVAISLPDAVKAAHAEGFGFGESVGRDAPALWLDAVLARKPRMPSDLEARLLQGSVLPIDSLLHDEVRHSLRRGFWDALESARR
jgi:hypothetical protein